MGAVIWKHNVIRETQKWFPGLALVGCAVLPHPRRAGSQIFPGGGIVTRLTLRPPAAAGQWLEAGRTRRSGPTGIRGRPGAGTYLVSMTKGGVTRGPGFVSRVSKDSRGRRGAFKWGLKEIKQGYLPFVIRDCFILTLKRKSHLEKEILFL